MCTCLDINKKDRYFGRTLDLEFHYNEEAVITPRNYKFKSPNGLEFKNKYAMIGTAMVFNDYPLYYEACNEYGLSIAGLNFPYNCVYFEPKDDKFNLTAFELIPYLLGKYKSIKELKDILPSLNITNVCFADDMPLSPLHFMISDDEECLVLEQTKDGLNIYKNEERVMTNNPPFPLQLENLQKYNKLTNKFIESKDNKYTCVGLGGIGLPGDSSSQSRFVKTCFLRKHTTFSNVELENVSSFFHILDNISMIKGCVLTKNNLEDITFYTSCINASKCIYYYKTYLNNQISSLKLDDTNKNSDKLTRFKLITEQNVNYLN